MMAKTYNGKKTADPPFDFAQGRLFGDDNKKSKSSGNSERGVPPLRSSR
jgi:hypothetical protein